MTDSHSKFESFVNSERCKTYNSSQLFPVQFESFVNSERCKTLDTVTEGIYRFESFVNSERCKTTYATHPSQHRLRALLIQKDVKLKQ